MRVGRMLIGFICLALASPLAAAEEGDAAKGKKEAAPIPDPQVFVTRHTGRFNGQAVRYTATAGETYIRDAEGKEIASFFATAYVKDGVEDATKRPVTFIFNGGPGSASLWLHMGVFGPRRIAISSEPEDDGAPPYPIVDNNQTLLDVTDMVFIDPVGTGYSRPLGDADPKKLFWGVMEDGRSVADFIQTWITDNKRWNSPKYLAGESYGTVRSAVLADELTKRNIALNGIVLISAVLDYQNSRFQHGSIMGYVSFLPSMAATAWYHNMLPERPDDLAAFLDEVREFAAGDYARALIQNNRLPAEQRQSIIERLHRYTGLGKVYLDRANFRVHIFRFFKELQRDRGLVTGRLDSRYTGTEPDDVGEFPEADPMGTSIGAAFTAAINTHLAGFLGVTMDRPYMIRAAEASPNWNWVVDKRAPNGGRYINVIPNLGRAMRRNKDLRVLVAAGYFDFATPFFGAENALSEDGLVQENIAFAYYQAGHMMYLHKPSRDQFLSDIRAFIKAGGAGGKDPKE